MHFLYFCLVFYVWTKKKRKGLWAFSLKKAGFVLKTYSSFLVEFLFSIFPSLLEKKLKKN